MTDTTNSLPIGRKRGRPVIKSRQMLRSMMPEMSERTFARFYQAILLARYVDGSDGSTFG